MKNKRANILEGNIIFIVLNVVFLAILILFLFKQGAGAVILEQAYAKQIALLIDSAEPGMVLKLNMKKVIEVAEKNKIVPDNLVSISDNIVQVKLSERGGYSYSFFNDVKVTLRYEEDLHNDGEKGYVFFIEEKNE